MKKGFTMKPPLPGGITHQSLLLHYDCLKASGQIDETTYNRCMEQTNLLAEKHIITK